MPQFLKRVREQQDFILLFIFLFFGAFLVLKSVPHLGNDRALLISAPVALCLGLGFAWGLARLRRKPNPIRTELHPLFGSIQLFHDHWKAKCREKVFDRGIELSGDTKQGSPTAAQGAMFEGIRERWEPIKAAAIKNLQMELQEQKPPFKPEELQLESIWLGGENSFSLHFGAPSRLDEAPDGFYVDFVDFKVLEVGWVH